MAQAFLPVRFSQHPPPLFAPFLHSERFPGLERRENLLAIAHYFAMKSLFAFLFRDRVSEGAQHVGVTFGPFFQLVSNGVTF